MLVFASIIATRFLFGISAFNLNKLQRVQNLAARLALNDWTTPPNTLLSKLHWLPVYSRIKFKISTITFKLLAESQPANLRSLIDSYAPTRLLRSSDESLLRQTRTHTSTGKRAFSVSAPSIWNSIPLPDSTFPLTSIVQTKFENFLFCHIFKSPANPPGLRFSFR